MDPGQEIRFRVSSIRFNPMPTAAQQAAAAAAATAPPAAGGGAAAAAAGGAAAAATPVVYSPMEIMGDIDGDGLGLTEWWAPAQDVEGGDGGGEAAADVQVLPDGADVAMADAGQQ